MFMRVNSKCARQGAPTTGGPDRAAPPVTVRDQSFFIASSASGLLAIESTDVEIDLVAPTVVAVNPPTVDSI